MEVGGEGALVLRGFGGGAAAEERRAAEAGAGLDLGDEAHLVHGVDAEAAVDLELAQQWQPQQRAHRIVRQRRRAAQRQPERLHLLACARTRTPHVSKTLLHIREQADRILKVAPDCMHR